MTFKLIDILREIEESNYPIGVKFSDLDLIKYLSDQGVRYRLYGDEEKFLRFLEENPEWGEAVIVSTEPDESQLNTSYDFDTGFIIEFKSKYYNFIISHGSPYTNPGGRRPKEGVIIKRMYRDGEERIRRKRDWRLDKEFVKNHVTCDIDSHENSCQIWTLAKVLDIPYGKAYEILSAEGWAPDDTRMAEIRWARAFKKLGIPFETIWSRWKREAKGMTMKNVVNRLPKKGKFAVTMRGHILAVVDGVIYDAADTPPYTRVEQIFKIGE